MSSVLRHHRAGDLVAFGEGGERTSSDLLRDAAKIAAALPRRGPRSEIAMVFETDRYAFAVAMLGAWLAGHAIALPPDGGPHTIAALLSKPRVVGLLHDTRAGGHLRVSTILASAGLTLIPTVSLPEILATAYRYEAVRGLEAYPRPTAQLLREVESVATALRIGAGERFVATVPPTHLHGLMHGVLLPLCTGGSFSRAIEHRSERSIAALEAYRPDTLVSVPAHLRALRRTAMGRFETLKKVISSTGHVDPLTGEALAEEGLQVFEVSLAASTGAVAWRRLGDVQGWAPLPGMQDDERHPGRSRIDDYAEDGAVEVGGERVVLSAVEASLLSRSGVEDAELAAVTTAEDGARVLAAVVAPGCDPQSLEAAIVEEFDALAGRLRVLGVDRLLREDTGELPRRALLRLFGLKSDGSAPSLRLDLAPPRDAPDGDPGVVRVRGRVPLDYVHFDGHFDGYPILPGVAQLHELLLPLVRRVRPDLGELCELQQVKFLGRIAPGDAIEVSLRFPANAPVCDFEISAGPRRCSAGRLRFAPGEAALEVP